MKRKELIALLESKGIVEKHQTGWYRSITNSEIASAVDLILLSAPFTTTLEIKNHLRSQGFWVVQQNVSDAMEYLYRAGVLDYFDNGTFRHYFYAKKY